MPRRKKISRNETSTFKDNFPDDEFTQHLYIRRRGMLWYVSIALFKIEESGLDKADALQKAERKLQTKIDKHAVFGLMVLEHIKKKIKSEHAKKEMTVNA